MGGLKTRDCVRKGKIPGMMTECQFCKKELETVLYFFCRYPRLTFMRHKLSCFAGSLDADIKERELFFAPA